MHLIGFQLSATKALKRPNAVRTASKGRCTAAGREVQVAWGDIHE